MTICYFSDGFIYMRLNVGNILNHHTLVGEKAHKVKRLQRQVILFVINQETDFSASHFLSNKNSLVFT